MVLPSGLGTAFLLAVVVGSGIMAARLAGGNGALALLCNTLPTGAILGSADPDVRLDLRAHTLIRPSASRLRCAGRPLCWPDAVVYIVAQIVGGVIGVWIAHLMFELPVWQVSLHARTGAGQWLAEFVATFGLLVTILGCVSAHTCSRALRGRPLHHLGLPVHRFDVLRRSGRDDCALAIRHLRGIAPAGVVPFIAAQFVGMFAAVVLGRWLWRT